MIEELPIWINVLFGLIVLVTIIWFFFATKSRTFLLTAMGWVLLQTVIGLSGFYQDTEAIPPRILFFGILPTLIFIALIFFTAKGKAFIDNMDLKTLTYFHTIRIPVEIVLSLLFYQGLVSVFMTFEGTNFDILAGITAPVVAYFGFRTGKVKRRLLLGWNIFCLLLLVNVVITAVFALPSPFQKFAFYQPNIAVFTFLLPCCLRLLFPPYYLAI